LNLIEKTGVFLDCSCNGHYNNYIITFKVREIYFKIILSAPFQTVGIRMKRKGLTYMKVMLVDDTPANLDVLRRTLEIKNYEISVATSGEQALRIAPKLRPDLILLDVMMPGMDGYETCLKLKKHPETWDIPIIFITAKSDSEDILKGFASGGVDYISKPFNQEEVYVRVKTQLALRSFSKQLSNLVNNLEDRNLELLQLKNINNKFLGIAAHDIRSPLAFIQTFSHLMIHEKELFSQEEMSEHLEAFHNTSRDLLNQINGLLDISVIESGKLTMNFQSEPLKPLIESRINLLKMAADNKKITINVDLDEIEEFPIDANRVAQIIDNLLSNAIKYSTHETQIHVSLKNLDDQVSVSIRDEGPGIAEKEQSDLRNFFLKINSQPTGGVKIPGLGLAIVQKMLGAHGGSLHLESTVGVGSTFSFNLPKRRRMHDTVAHS